MIVQEHLRYKVVITYKLGKIEEFYVKSISEANGWLELCDNTVKHAYIIDRTNARIIHDFTYKQ